MIGKSPVMPVALLAVMELSNMTRYVLFIICDFHSTCSWYFCRQTQWHVRTSGIITHITAELELCVINFAFSPRFWNTLRERCPCQIFIGFSCHDRWGRSQQDRQSWKVKPSITENRSMLGNNQRLMGRSFSFWISETFLNVTAAVQRRAQRASSSTHSSIPRRTLIDVQNIFGRLFFPSLLQQLQIKVLWRSARCKFQLLVSEHFFKFTLQLFCLLASLFLDLWVSCRVNMMWPVKQNNRRKNKKMAHPSSPPYLSIETISGLF